MVNASDCLYTHGAVLMIGMNGVLGLHSFILGRSGALFRSALSPIRHSPALLHLRCHLLLAENIFATRPSTPMMHHPMYRRYFRGTYAQSGEMDDRDFEI
jgi:hypothetical protein